MNIKPLLVAATIALAPLTSIASTQATEAAVESERMNTDILFIVSQQVAYKYGKKAVYETIQAQIDTANEVMRNANSYYPDHDLNVNRVLRGIEFVEADDWDLAIETEGFNGVLETIYSPIIYSELHMDLSAFDERQLWLAEMRERYHADHVVFVSGSGSEASGLLVGLEVSA